MYVQFCKNRWNKGKGRINLNIVRKNSSKQRNIKKNPTNMQDLALAFWTIIILEVQIWKQSRFKSLINKGSQHPDKQETCHIINCKSDWTGKVFHLEAQIFLLQYVSQWWFYSCTFNYPFCHFTESWNTACLGKYHEKSLSDILNRLLNLICGFSHYVY